MNHTKQFLRTNDRRTSVLCFMVIAGMVLSLGSLRMSYSQDTSPAIPRTQPTGDIQVGFRIDVDIYVDETKPPVLQHKTLFTDKLAIDLDSQRNGVVVLDYSAGTLTVMDSRNRTQTNLELADVNAMLKDALAQSPAATSYPPSRDAGNLLVMGDDTVQYKVKTEKPSASLLATRYAEFADATTKIAAIFPPYKPPQLRLELNKTLREANELPMVTTRLTNVSGTQSTVIARLLIKPQLDAEDNKDIQIVHGYFDQFKHLSSNEFFGVK